MRLSIVSNSPAKVDINLPGKLSVDSFAHRNELNVGASQK